MPIVIEGKDVSSRILSGREIETGDAVWIPGQANKIEQDQFLEEVRQSSIGKRFFAKYPLSENLPLIQQTVGTLYPATDYVTTRIFLDAMNTLMTGAKDRLFSYPVVVTPPPPPPPPTDRNGKVLSASQRSWQEHAEWSTTANSQQIAERRRTDSSFAKFYEASLRAELQTEIDGDARKTNPHLREQPRQTQADVNLVASRAGLTVAELQAWVKTYNATPASQVRSLRSAGSNPTGYQQYEKSFEAAMNARLI